MKPVRLARLAQKDISEAHEWYEDQRPGLGVSFVRAVDSTLDGIRDSPRRYPVVHASTRRAFVGRFPYGLYFVELEDYLRVIAVTHLRMHPQRWQNRR